MPFTASPLRYPGGKTQLYQFVKDLIICNSMQSYTYVEPFAGGAGLALKLLYNKMVSCIIINDIDPAIYAMWYSCLNYPEELIHLVDTVPLTVSEWDAQKAIYSSPEEHSILQLGFAALYLNRTNISGIVNGGVLGGRNQDGRYKIDARFNRDTLASKIRRIYKYRSQISLFNLDASTLIRIIALQPQLFFNIDPPYVGKGAQLYRNYYHEQDHRDLARLIACIPHPWIVTYDSCEFVRSLYRDWRCSLLRINYSAQSKRLANEYVLFSNELIVPDYISFC